MGNSFKLLAKLSTGHFRNVSFSDFQKLLEEYGFVLDRVAGSHHIYTHPDLVENVNIQNVKGEAKPYQIRQMLSLVEMHNLKLRTK